MLVSCKVTLLRKRGIIFAELQKEVGQDVDVFDLISHIAYGQKPLTRSERLMNVQRSRYVDTYEGEAREIIDLLLEKCAEHGITPLMILEACSSHSYAVRSIRGGCGRYFLRSRRVCADRARDRTTTLPSCRITVKKY